MHIRSAQSAALGWCQRRALLRRQLTDLIRSECSQLLNAQARQCPRRDQRNGSGPHSAQLLARHASQRIGLQIRNRTRPHRCHLIGTKSRDRIRRQLSGTRRSDRIHLAWAQGRHLLRSQRSERGRRYLTEFSGWNQPDLARRDRRQLTTSDLNRIT